MKTLLSLLALAFLVTGCEYTQPLCSSANKVDVPGFEGDYEITGYDAGAFSVKKSAAVIKHTGKGEYSDGNGASLTTCFIAGRTILEAYNSGTGTYSAAFLSVGLSSFDYTPVAFDESELKSSGIPYEIDEGTLKVFGVEHGIFGRNQKKLIIDNKNIAPEIIVEKMHDLSLKFWARRH